MKAILSILLFPLLLAAEPLSVEQLFNVRTTTVKKERAAAREQFYGYVRADESRRLDVAPRFGGYVETLYADRTYAYVEKGAPLAKVYSPEVLRAKEEYRSTLRYTKSHADAAMLASAREKLELLGIGAAEIKSTGDPKSDLRITTLRAPVSGYLFAKSVNAGSAFKAGTKLFEIVDLSSVWVEARIGEEQLSGLDSRRFTVRSKAYDESYPAKASQLYPEISPKEALATLRLSVENPKRRLFPGMYVTVEAAAEARSRLTLPKSAVIRKNGKWYAFTVGEYEGEYAPVEVKVAPLDDDRYTVLEGVEAGQKVVDNALFMMDSDAQLNGLY